MFLLFYHIAEREGLQVFGLMADDLVKDLSSALCINLQVMKTKIFKTCTGTPA